MRSSRRPAACGTTRTPRRTACALDLVACRLRVADGVAAGKKTERGDEADQNDRYRPAASRRGAGGRVLHSGASLSEADEQRRGAASAAGGRRPRSDRPARASGPAGQRLSPSQRRPTCWAACASSSWTFGSFGWSATRRLYASTASVASVCASWSAALISPLRLRVDRGADAVGEDRLPAGPGRKQEPLRRHAEGRADLEDLRVALTLRGA